jgi:DNA-binding LytR/AlgR family response regulator
MQIIIQDPSPGEEDCVIIRVKRMTDSIIRAINVLKSPDNLTVFDGEQAALLAINNVFYAESVDLKTFIYAERIVYRSKLKLYEVEELLNSADFLRVSKQTIVNVRKIRSVASAGEGRFQATLLNDEKVIVSRQYVPALKKRFGL